MSDGSKPAGPAAASTSGAVALATVPATVSVPGARLPYRAPSLRRLGCVRDLALGGASGVAEGAGTFGPRKMM